MEIYIIDENGKRCKPTPVQLIAHHIIEIQKQCDELATTIYPCPCNKCPCGDGPFCPTYNQNETAKKILDGKQVIIQGDTV